MRNDGPNHFVCVSTSSRPATSTPPAAMNSRPNAQGYGVDGVSLHHWPGAGAPVEFGDVDLTEADAQSEVEAFLRPGLGDWLTGESMLTPSSVAPNRSMWPAPAWAAT